MIKTLALGLIGFVVSLSSFAQSLDLPLVKEGDAWTYRDTVDKSPTGWSQTHDEITISRVTNSTLYSSEKQIGSTQVANEMFWAPDWTFARDVNGKETVVTKPLSFPLSIGKTWEVQYTEQHPNKLHTYERFERKYTVVGYEMIEVPAGKFKALKIEMDGRWFDELAPAQAVIQGAQTTQNSTSMVTEVRKTTADSRTGRIYEAYWYVPEAKRWVKNVYEIYTPGGLLERRKIHELDAFKISN